MPKRNLIWIAAVIAAAAVTLWVTQSRSPAPGRPDVDELHGVAEAYRTIQDQYYRPVDARELREGAVSGMVSTLDEYSTYIAPEKLEAFQSRMRGIDRGLGLKLEETPEGVRVVGPLLNSPAHHGGIHAGDELLAVDGKDVAAMDLPAVEAMLRGPFGTKAELTIRRGEGAPKTFTLTRGEFPLESVEGLYRDESGQWVYSIGPEGQWGYVRIREFVPDTDALLRDVLRRLGAGAGLVLDLRDNPGGTLPAAAEVANEFLRQGVIVTCVSRAGKKTSYRVQPDGVFRDAPMIVLVNSRTASAAEIVAGALRLYDRAVIIGTRTRGKGCVQSMLSLPDGLGQVNLTTAELLVGASQSISRTAGSDVWGVDPHPFQEIILPPERQARLEELWVRSEVLPDPADAATTRPTATAAAANATYRRYLAVDLPLVRAIELLADPKAMTEILADEAARRAEKDSAATQPERATDE